MHYRKKIQLKRKILNVTIGLFIILIFWLVWHIDYNTEKLENQILINNK